MKARRDRRASNETGFAPKPSASRAFSPRARAAILETALRAAVPAESLTEARARARARARRVSRQNFADFRRSANPETAGRFNVRA